MNRTWFGVGLLAGMAVRAAALPLPGTRDTVPWRIWSYNAATEGVSRLYGVGGSPPNRRVLEYAGAETTVDYPPLALYELGLAGRAYRFLMGGQFPNTTPLYVAVKAPAVLADAAFAVLLYVVVRRRLGERTARCAMIAYWLNPGVILDGAILAYLDPQFVLPAAASLVAATGGASAVAGALGAAALLTKPQAAVIGPAIALAIWNAGADGRRVRAFLAAVAGALATAAVVVGPILAVGGGPNLLQAVGRVSTHDMLSGKACNLWWIVGYIVRALYSIQDYGVWGAFGHETQILQISRFVEVGFPNPRPIGAGLVLAAIAWAIWTARRAKDLWLLAALGAFSIHAFETLAAQVHENHLFAALPLLTIAAAGRRSFGPVLVAVSAIFALNLNIFYGMSEDLGYRIPRGLTIVDLSVLLAVVNCATLAWHATVFKRECIHSAGPCRLAP
jgi:hypothetical protein